jgi:hypothetical protein
MVRGFHVAAEIAAVDFRDLALASKLAALHFFGHGFAQFMEQHEGGLVGQAKIAGDRQGALAFYLIAVVSHMFRP